MVREWILFHKKLISDFLRRFVIRRRNSRFITAANAVARLTRKSVRFNQVQKHLFTAVDKSAQLTVFFSNEIQGNVYSRYTNPAVRAFEERLAAMEGGEQAVATSSGMAAINCVCMGLLSAGDHVVCSQSVFGNSALMFKNIMAKFAIIK